MVITEYYRTRKDGVVLNRTYSDKGMLILQNETGIEYAEAIDVEGAPYTYTETDKPIEVDPTLDNEAFIAAYEKAIEPVEETSEEVTEE